MILLRTYRIPRPVTVKVRDDFYGRRSWLEITAIFRSRARPCSPTRSSTARREEIEAIVEGGVIDRTPVLA